MRSRVRNGARREDRERKKKLKLGMEGAGQGFVNLGAASICAAVGDETFGLLRRRIGIASCVRDIKKASEIRGLHRKILGLVV